MLKKYKLKPEHKEQLRPWVEKWIANAMSTAPMTEEERRICVEAVEGLYHAANLNPPPRHRIIFVPSPFVAAFAGGFAAAILYKKKNGSATRHATSDATRDATQDVIRGATQNAIETATRDAIRGDMRDAIKTVSMDAIKAAMMDTIDETTYFATDAATQKAIYEATTDAIEDATINATVGATRAATRAAMWATMDETTWNATWNATGNATEGAIKTATRNATEGAISDAMQDAIKKATSDATQDATRVATGVATMDASWNAMEEVSWNATWNATVAPTRDFTGDATEGAIRDATRDTMANEKGKFDKWFVLNENPVLIAKRFGQADFLLECASRFINFWNGGNQWSGYSAFLSFFRHIVKLPLDYSKWQHYETLATHSGPRVMHEEFCIISDRPKVLKVDDLNRPHCEDGPFCQWSDGSALYAIHGVRVPAWMIEFPEALTPEKIQQEKDLEVQRIMIERYGAGKYLMETGAKLLDMDTLTLEGSAPRALFEDKNGNKFLVGTDGSTKRVYHMAVPRAAMTCAQAHAEICGFDESRLIAEC